MGAVTGPEIRRLGWLAGAVSVLHISGWGLFAWYARSYPSLAGLGTLAYAFGLRHAFDADHIAAIDNTARKLLQSGRRSLSVGFFFSLGHSTVVLGLTTALALAARTMTTRLSAFRGYGSAVGMSISGVFLMIIGLLNLLVLLDVLGAFRVMRRGRYDEGALEHRLLSQGLMSRIFLRRLADQIDRSWKMYPLGVLFGLGFDTATEVGLLAVAAGVATQHVPVLAILSLPVLFAAGMCLMDTADGAFISHAYGWAFSNPVRKVYYNITVTSLSVLVAIAIGGIELLQVAASKLSLWPEFANLDLNRFGYLVVALFGLTWLASLTIWRLAKIEERWSAGHRSDL